MRGKNAEIVVDKHDQLVAIERFELPPIDVPESLLTCLVELALLLLPQEESSGESFHELHSSHSKGHAA